LQRRLGEDFDEASFQTPRLMVHNPQFSALADLIARECAAGEPLHDLYGDGLTLALLLAVLETRTVERRQRSKLAQWQLRRVTDFIEDNCLRTIRLEELANLAGLSQSYFSHAFKASTGLPPHQWQMRARMERVKGLLALPGRSLTDIAGETGFADAAHLTRMFRQHVGVPPSSWRRDRSI